MQIPIELSFLFNYIGTMNLTPCPFLGSVHRISLNWNGKNLLMDVPSSAMGDRILNTGDEVSFHINEKNAVKIGNKR